MKSKIPFSNPLTVLTVVSGLSVILPSVSTAVAAPSTIRASVSDIEEVGNSNGYSYDPFISADGRYVAFWSGATNLVAGGSNSNYQIYVYDLKNRVTQSVSVDNTGHQGNNWSYSPSISANNRFVVFTSEASNLVAGDNNGQGDVFVHDLKTGVTQRVSVDSMGHEGNGFSGAPSISSGGRYVAFCSDASNLVAGDDNGYADVFVRDLKTGITQRVSVDTAGAEANNGSCGTSSSISANGRYVAFYSNASNLVAGDNNGSYDVFVRNLKTGVTQRVSVDSAGVEANGDSFFSSFSANGRFVTFSSDAGNLVLGDTNGLQDVFVRDLKTGVTQRVSVDSAGNECDLLSCGYSSSISANGRYVAFESQGNNLVAGDIDGRRDVFVHDLKTGVTERVSEGTVGEDSNYDAASSSPSISATGHYVAFDSDLSNLVEGDNNGLTDIFVRRRW